MKLTVLGKYGPFPHPGGACSRTSSRVRAAPAAARPWERHAFRLLRLVPALHIDAVLISHLHSDHMADLLILRYALQQYNARGQDVPRSRSPSLPRIHRRKNTVSLPARACMT